MLTALLALSLAAEPKAGRCQGTIVPPAGYLNEMAFVANSTPNARDEASSHAKDRLLDRLCQGDCQDLRPELQVWDVRVDGEVTCAMAVVEEAAYRRWKSQAEGLFDLDGAHDQVVTELFAGVGKPDAGKLSVSVIIDKVFDEDSNGGPRSLWLSAAMAGALSRAGVNQLDPPGTWAGDGVPRPADAVLRGQLVGVTNGAKPVLDLTWSVRFTEKLRQTNRTSRVVHIPEGKAPKRRGAGGGAFTTADQDSLFIRLDTAAGGVLCNGQQTQLTVHSDTERCVRVFDVYGDVASVLFPSAEHGSCTVLKGESLPLGGSLGFGVVLDPSTEVERFVAVGAPSVEAFPKELKKLNTACRMSRQKLESILKRARGLLVREESVRVLREGPACAGAPKISPAEMDQVQASLKSLPECK